MSSCHRHRVNEIRKRSILKTITSRIIETIVDTLLIGSVYFFLGVPNSYELASALSIAIEVLCTLTTYLNDRLWNKIQWGREVEDIET